MQSPNNQKNGKGGLNRPQFMQKYNPYFQGKHKNINYTGLGIQWFITPPTSVMNNLNINFV